MTDEPDLDGAYALNSPEAVTELYADWAETYDAEFAATHGYALPDHVARAYAELASVGLVLDIGAGTGLVAECLSAKGFDQIDGTDISPDMLEVARAKSLYRTCFVADITDTLGGPDDRYAGAVSAGTFTLGHVGPEALAEVIRVVHPGGWIVISVNERHWRDAGFPEVLKGFSERIHNVRTAEVAIYAAGSDHEHSADRALILLMQVR